MTERSGVFSAGATGVPVTTTNIVLDESYKKMNQNTSPSSPAQNDVVQNHTTTNNNTQTSTDINTTADEERPPPERLSSNNSNDVWSVGSIDWHSTHSRELEYLCSQNSGKAAEGNMILGGHLTNDRFDYSRASLPANVTTSNSKPPQPPKNVNEKNHQGKVAKEVQYSSCGWRGSRSRSNRSSGQRHEWSEKEKEKERCDLGAMTERSGVFSAGATGVPVTTTNIVLDESYKTSYQNASPSSPAQNDVVQNHATTNNNTATSTDINTRSLFREPQFFTPASLMAPSDEERPPPEPLSSNNSNDIWSGGSRDRQRSLSEDSGYYVSQGSVMAAEDDIIWLDTDVFLNSSSTEQDISSGCLDDVRWAFLEYDSNSPQPLQNVIEKNHQGKVAKEFDKSRGLLPDNVTTSNSNPPQPPQIVIEKNHQGEVAPREFDKSRGLLPDNVTTSNSNPPQPPQIVIEKNHQGEVAPREMTNSDLITDYSSRNNTSVPLTCDEDEIQSQESSEVEASSESLVNTSEGNHEVKSYHVPEIGMKFSCEEEALKFYKKYAMEMGFKVRKGKVQRLANKSLRKRYFYCSNEGFRSKKQPTNRNKYMRKETRTGCKAMIQITFKNKECFISQFIPEHNHDLQGSTQRYYMDSCSKIPEADSLIQPIREIEAAKEVEAGARPRFCDMSYSKHLCAKKSNILQPEDAQGLIDYLKKLQVEDLSLFYTFQVDDKSHMTNFFWRDGRSKIDYYYFGDVLILDTTFKMDKYNMICAPFLGLNHHRRHVLFGCAFLLDESVESFTWLLRTFIEAMDKRQPKTIFTTECLAISEAVEVTLPKSQHLLCKQLVCQNAKQHLSMYFEQPKFESHFHSCLFDCQSEGEFQLMWRSLLEQYNLREDPWLQNMYTLRSKWCYLFSKITFCGGIHSNQGSENFSNANIFQNRESEAMTLTDFVLKYEKAAEQQRIEELEDDSFCPEPNSTLSSTPMYIQAANVYTPTMLEIFSREFIESLSVPLKRARRTGSVVTLEVTKGEKTEYVVEFNSLDFTTTCSCKKFESVGIICAHALKVLITRNIFQVPPQYILKRWTKSAKVGVVEDDQNGEEIADNSESLCKSKFMHKALNVITKSVAVKKTRKIAERYLDIALKEVDDVLKKGNEHYNTKDAEVNHEDVRNTSSVARVELREKLLKAVYPYQEETSKGRMESQIQKKRKNEEKEKMNLPSSSMSLP